jgi:hypothetical protein
MMLSLCLIVASQGFSFAAEMPSEKEVGAKFPEKKWFEKVHMAGFVDVYYSYNFNQPGDGPGGRVNQLRNFDIYNDQFALSMAELVFHKDPDPFGFRVDLDFGTTTEWVHCGGVVTCPGGATEGTFKHIQQAYLSWKPSSMWSIEAGKFVTHLGFEVIESKDNWNYSRSLLFAWAIPYYHSGLRISHTHENFWINGYIYNGWNNVVEDNAGKTFGAQLGLTPIKGLTIIQNWIGGPEPAGESRQVLDTVVMFSPVDMLSLGLNYDYGWFKTSTAGDRIWTGVAAYAKIAPTDRLAFIPRFEWFDDQGGFATTGTTTATGRIIKEFTLTAEHKCSDNLLTRLEYRSDWSTANVFASETGASDTDTQDTVTLGLVYSF